MLPKAKREQLFINNKPLHSGMMENVRQLSGTVTLDLGSGNYTFRYPMTN
jgi:hypothetical protein